MAFIARVMRNSSDADREDRLVADRAGRDVPVAVAPMKAVIVSTDSPGSKVRLACQPAASSTIIVSPTAREMPSTNEATMPEIAAGKTTRVETLSFVAPSA